MLTNRLAPFVVRLAGFALLITTVATLAVAQSNRGTIKGTVTDQTGAIVQNATVTAVNIGTNAERSVTSGEDGTYEVPLLEPGIYKVTVTAPNFAETVRENIVVRTANTEVVDLALGAAQVGGSVTITAEPNLVQTETSERSSVISGREVTELPLSGRNFTQLATLTPGVVRSNNVGVGGGPEARSFNNGDPRSGSGGPGSSNENGSSESSRFNRSGGANISANGQRPTNNNFSLDGVDNNEPQFGTIGVYPNPDSIAEFKVSTSVPPAEVGRAAGAVVTVTTKSGSNEFRGSLYYYGKNSALNAYHPVLKTKLAEAIGRNASTLEIEALQKPVQQEHEFGGTLGGPIIKNRTFFFFDFLGQRNNLPFPNDTVVPAVGVTSGDFSAFPQIFNPFTGQPFTNNQIPQNMINTVGRNYLSAYPAPTRNVFNAGKFCGSCSGGSNYFFQRANNEEINNVKIRIDHRISDKNTLNGSFNDQRLTTLRANFFPGNIPTAGFGAGEERGNSRLTTISDVHTFKPTLLNEFRFGLSEIQISIFNCGVGGACGVSPTFAEDIGIPNSNDGSVEASGGALIGNFETGFLEFTGDGGLFQVKSKNPYFADTVTFIKNDHALKVGGEVRLRYLETIDGGRTGTLKGQFQYGNTGPITGPNPTCPAGSGTAAACFVRPDGIPFGGSGNGQANILLGLPALLVTKSRIFGGPFNLRSQEWGFFIQDDWKVNDRLSLNLGLRYDLFTPFSESEGRYSLFSIADRRVNVASGGGDRIIETDKNNFGPRIGFAYALDGEKSMVLRGGYGLLYTLDGVDYPPGVRNVPFSNSISLNQNGNNTSPTATVFTLQSGPPQVTSAPDPANVPSGFGVFAVDEEQKVGMVHQFQISFQYQFLNNYSFDIGYVGNRSRNLLYANNIGAGGTAEARNAAGEFIGSGVIYTNGAKSQYDGLQMQVQRRLANNFQGQVSYTFSRTLDNSTGIFNGLGDQRQSRSGPINPFDLDADWGNSPLDTRHLLSSNVIIDLPFGRGQRYLDRPGASNVVFGGWQANFIVSARSGLPFSVVTDNGGLGRPSLVGDPFSNVPAGRLLNPAAFSVTTGITTVTNPAGNSISFGDLKRNTFRGPSQFFTDMSIFKNTQLAEQLKLQLGIEFFNLFNRVNFTVPNNNIGNPASPNGDFGEIKYNAYGGRVVQYRVKLLF